MSVRDVGIEMSLASLVLGGLLAGFVVVFWTVRLIYKALDFLFGLR